MPQGLAAKVVDGKRAIVAYFDGLPKDPDLGQGRKHPNTLHVQQRMKEIK